MLLSAFRQHSTKLVCAAAGVLLATDQCQNNKVATSVVHCESNPDSHPALREVELKNGSKVPLAIVGASMSAFSALMKENPLALYELFEKCKNDGHELWPGTETVLKDRALLDGKGKAHRSICNVLLSAIIGDDGLDFALRSPYKPKEKYSMQF